MLLSDLHMGAYRHKAQMHMLGREDGGRDTEPKSNHRAQASDSFLGHPDLTKTSTAGRRSKGRGSMRPGYIIHGRILTKTR